MTRTLLATTLTLILSTAHAAPLSIDKQGSFTIGGSYVTHDGAFRPENFTAPDGQRAYGDFAYVKYQMPVEAKKTPLIFQHGWRAILAHLGKHRRWPRRLRHPLPA